MNVGVREFRDSLSRHLAAVRSGATVTVTDHGRPVARLVPIGAPTNLERLIREGRVTPARRPKRPAGRPARAAHAGATVTDLIADQRR